MKKSPTTASARMSRERSSSRCEISVPSTSVSGSSLIGGGIRGGGIFRNKRLWWQRRRRGRRRRRIHDRALHIVGFLLQLITELARHRARVAEPAPHERRHLRQFLRAEHDERDHKNDQQLGKATLEHARILKVQRARAPASNRSI